MCRQCQGRKSFSDSEKLKEYLHNHSSWQGECWEWDQSTSDSGYGVVWIDGKLHRVHRVSYLLHKGPIPDGEDVLHTCDNPPCWNPEHLFTGTPTKNAADMLSKGRHWTKTYPGELNGSAILNWDKVNALRSDAETGRYTQRELGRKYRISQRQAGRIINRESWTTVSTTPIPIRSD